MADETRATEVRKLVVSERATEILAAALMSIAVLLTAFSAWQATRWSGVQAVAFTEASSARTQSVAELNVASAQIAYDANTFSAFVLEFRGGAQEGEARQELLDLIDRVVRDEFRPAVDAWLALNPANNPDAPKTPFEMEEYTNARQEEALRLQRLAEEKVEEGKEANQTGDDYVLATVFFASVLFFAGISSKLEGVNVRMAVLVLASVGLAGGLLRMLTLPFH